MNNKQFYHLKGIREQRAANALSPHRDAKIHAMGRLDVRVGRRL